MTRILLIALTALLAVAPTASAQLNTGGVASDNVEFVKNIAKHSDSAGGRLKDGFFYITTERDLTIYDVSNPENPVETGSLFWDTPGQPAFTEEDPDTNGRILLRWDGGLQVIDVSDKSNPTVLSTLDEPDQHTVTCVLDCTYAYGSEGTIVDLRDPKNPKVVGDWSEQYQPGSNHDVTEVAPGLVLTATEPVMLLDARTNPAAPTQLATGAVPGFAHATLWPNGGTDDFALVGGESAGPDCSEADSAYFATMNTVGWASTKTFSVVDQFKMSTGALLDGRAPETTWCVHWFDTHPTYGNGGLVAIAWYEHGTRFLQVGTDGKLAEIGYFLPYGGQTSGVYWISPTVLYTADYYRGLDILKFTGPVPQGRTPAMVQPGESGGASTGTRITTPSASFDDLIKWPSSRRCVRPKKFRIKAKANQDPVTAITLRINRKVAKRVRGSAVRKGVKVRKLPKGRFTALVEVTTRSGHKTAGQRTYRRCK